MNARVFVFFSNLFVFDRQEAVRPATEKIAKSIKKAHALHDFDRRLHVGDTIQWPIAQYALDDIGVVAIHPVRELIISRWESIRRGIRTECRHSGQVGVELSDGHSVSVPALIVHIAVRINVVTQEPLEATVTEGIGGEIIGNRGIDGD